MASGQLKPCRQLLLLLLLLRSIAGGSAEVYDCGTPEDIDVPEDDDVDPLEVRDYIVHVEPPRLELEALHAVDRLTNFYESLVETALSSAGTATTLTETVAAAGLGGGSSRVINTYRHVMKGFAAKLNKEEVEVLSTKTWFVHAYPDQAYRPLTTYTPEFLSLRDSPRGQGTWNTSNMGEGIIIGVVDTGVTPSHPSFHDQGMPPPPDKWKGRCDFPPGVCNNKLIGARSFVNSTEIADVREAPYDEYGHGTHTASTAAGAFVKDASVFGLARGEAAGMAPRAHVAIYKVCSGSCRGKDIIAGMDAAVADGVDVISISIGPLVPSPFHSDSVSSSAFGAIEKGIIVSASAGNDGPWPRTVKNGAPWVFTIGASTIDRTINAKVKLGDGQEFDGESLYQPGNFTAAMLPLVFPGGITGNESVAKCVEGSLDGIDVHGKIVLCEYGLFDTVEKGGIVKAAGGVAMILMNNEHHGNSISADMHVLPVSYVTYADGSKIRAYVNSTHNPVATISFRGAVHQPVPGSPAISLFSSRGPSKHARCILKPDITGPGVDILAAWPVPADDSKPPAGSNEAYFNIISGTSMACPHLSGISALIKKAHPDWSPAMIKSALMTTAYVTDRNEQPIADERGVRAGRFATGAGNVDPLKAMEPGIVYDITTDEYISFLCGLQNYTDDHVRAITNRADFKCSSVKTIGQAELNYPSIVVELRANVSGAVVVRRTATNVGQRVSTYVAHVEAPEGVAVSVDPPRLEFSSAREKKSYDVTLSSNGDGSPGIVEGQLKWVSGNRVAASQIVVRLV